MKLERVIVGPLETNCYILSIGEETLIIDPGDDFYKIKNVIQNKKTVGVIITHYHFDHIGALKELISYTNSKVYDYKNLKEGQNHIGKFYFDIIKTPGHKEDLISILFKNEKKLFCGDFIFEGSIGRCDLEGGDFKIMQESIKKILMYDDDIVIYPGHGPSTSLGRERTNLNFYL